MGNQVEPRTGEVLPNGSILTDRYAAQGDWQLWNTQEGSALLVSAELCDRWIDAGYVEPGLFLPADCGLYAIEAEGVPSIASVELGPFPQSGQHAMELAKLFAYSRKMLKGAHLAGALYVPQLPYLLPTAEGDDSEQDPFTLGRWLTGGMNAPFNDGTRMRSWIPGMTESMYAELLERFGWEETAPEKIRTVDHDDAEPYFAATKRTERRREGPFCLPGRPDLEKFFRERIIDVIDREEEYKRMGIEFPGPTLFTGPPGCGKTYAVEKLVEYLGWPSYSVNSGTIGSSYIHETSRLISKLFDKAIKDAPSIVIIDEMESFLTDRNMGHQHHVEEVAEFLRVIPTLPKNHVLLFAMTNLPERIDKAITRKGRFDNIIEINPPSHTELIALLESLLKDIPTDRDLDLDFLASRLHNRPISDVVYVVREAGRQAVLHGEDRITNTLLSQAYDDLVDQGGKASSRTIGFL